MTRAEDIIIRPLITEKSNELMGLGKYTFVVDKRATKIDVKKAIEKLFGVKVLRVSIMNYRGKNKRVGVHRGQKPSWKKAIVTILTEQSTSSYLKKGGEKVNVDKKYNTEIEIFEAAQ